MECSGTNGMLDVFVSSGIVPADNVALQLSFASDVQPGAVIRVKLLDDRAINVTNGMGQSLSSTSAWRFLVHGSSASPWSFRIRGREDLMAYDCR